MRETVVNQPQRGENESSRSAATNSEPALTRRAAKDSDDMADTESSSKSPAFRFYPTDFISDSKVAVMSLQERGVYITLLCHCWTDGSLPIDLTLLARLCGCPVSAFRKLWPAVGRCFREQDGVLIQPRLERERAKQAEFRRRQAENGKRGGRPQKPTGKPNRTQTKPTGNPSLSQTQTQTKPKKSLPFSSSFPSSFSEEIPTAENAERVSAAERDPDLAEATDGREVGAFIRRFCELYSRYRHKAKYFVKRSQHVPIVRQLLNVYTLQRLEKLAVVLLTTDDEWISNTDRGLNILSVKAAWLDGLLAEHEAKHGELEVAS